MILMEGIKLKEKIMQELQEKTNNLPRPIKVVIIQVGQTDASNLYIKQMKKLEKDINILIEHISFTTSVEESEIITKILKLNKEKSIDGIMVQMPLPSHLNAKKIINTIDQNKDIEGLTDENVMNLYNDNYSLVPCTALGIVELLKYYKIDLKGKNIVILGKSDIVGKPLAALLSHYNKTITLCDSKTKSIGSITKQADILISAIGKANFITKDYIKKGATIIDAGINKNQNGKLCGDVNFEEVKEITSYITPVPKGIGAATTAMFLKNSYKAYLLNSENQ